MFNFLLFAFLAISPQDFVRQVDANLLLDDSKAAVEIARQGVAEHPDDVKLQESLIKSLAASGERVAMMEAWATLEEAFPEKAHDRLLLEEMGWGILSQGKKSESLSTRAITLLGSAVTQDVRAVPVLKEVLNDPSSALRGLAVELSSHYGDHALKEEIVRLFKSERVLSVRLKVIESLAKLRMHAILPDMIERLGNRRLNLREQGTLVKAIALMQEEMSGPELELLASSRRAGLRLLACECIAHLEIEEMEPLLYRLAFDENPQVRVAAIRTMGILRVAWCENLARLAESYDPDVGITASWALLLSDHERGNKAFARWLEHSKAPIRAKAAGAVAQAGVHGVDVARHWLTASKDPYVRVNLAVALLSQKEEEKAACKEIAGFLEGQKEKIMRGSGFFTPVRKSNVVHAAMIPNYPEAVNQAVRLELLNLLAMRAYPGSLEAIKDFLTQRRWGVTGLAAELLLGEGDPSAIDLVRTLLDDPSRQVRGEAALILAMWGRDPAALPILEELYVEGDRTLKIQILEALGRIGDREALPFLIERLSEPSETLRLVASAIMIQILNH